MCGAELKALPEGVQRVAAVLQAKGHPHGPLMLDDAARTAQQAADALGIALGQIAKSIVFRRKSDDAAVLVITAGDKRVDEKKVEALVCEGTRLGRADAAFVKASTGFSIGGVSPLAHSQAPVTLIDQTLLRFEEIWAAAGHPHAVFRLSPLQLQSLTGAALADIAIDTVQERASLQHAIDLVAAKADEIRGQSANIPSPCISICRMDAKGSRCEGCFRTRDEIAAWSQASDDDKRAIWTRIEQRMASLQAGTQL